MVVPWEIGARQKNTSMNKEAMYRNLLDFKEAMDKANIPFIWTFGGLLGLMRDGDLIEWDNDVDFACFASDHVKIKKVIDELKQKNFYIPDKNECPLNDHFFIRDQEKIEVWWYQKINHEWIYDNNIRYNEAFFDNCENIDFLNVTWTVPANPKLFLEITYGNDWKIPNKYGTYIL